jgi:hypothetical protein
MIDNVLTYLSNDKIFIGCILLLSNLGGKYLQIDFPKNIDSIFTKYFILRCIVLFSIFFMATRDIKISILLSLLSFILIYYFINENSSFCILNKYDQIDDNKITLEDYNKAKELIRKFNNA